ncbi:MAG: hypothetical protein RL026_447 [Pseudomonadota bacterium]|jgi:phosphohistidine phosphatase
MARLTLLRHGRAAGPAGTAADFDRALDGQGRAEARAAGAAIAQISRGDVLVLFSSARRTRETAELVGEALEANGHCQLYWQEQPDLYLASAPLIARALREAHAAHPRHALLLVGHNLGLSELAARLGALPGGQLGTGEWTSLPDYQPEAMP